MDDTVRGLEYLADRPQCEFPPFERINRWARPPTRDHRKGQTPKKVPPSDRRSTSDKTGEATRRRIRELLIRRHGPICHICLAAGITDQRALIDLELKWPHPYSFTRDHVKPRSQRGTDSLRNQRPAHKVCNERRGAKPLIPC